MDSSSNNDPAQSASQVQPPNEAAELSTPAAQGGPDDNVHNGDSNATDAEAERAPNTEVNTTIDDAAVDSQPADAAEPSEPSETGSDVRRRVLGLEALHVDTAADGESKEQPEIDNESIKSLSLDNGPLELWRPTQNRLPAEAVSVLVYPVRFGPVTQYKLDSSNVLSIGGSRMRAAGLAVQLVTQPSMSKLTESTVRVAKIVASPMGAGGLRVEDFAVDTRKRAGRRHSILVNSVNQPAARLDLADYGITAKGDLVASGPSQSNHPSHHHLVPNSDPEDTPLDATQAWRTLMLNRDAVWRTEQKNLDDVAAETPHMLPTVKGFAEKYGRLFVQGRVKSVPLVERTRYLGRDPRQQPFSEKLFPPPEQFRPDLIQFVQARPPTTHPTATAVIAASQEQWKGLDDPAPASPAGDATPDGTPVEPAGSDDLEMLEVREIGLDCDPSQVDADPKNAPLPAFALPGVAPRRLLAVPPVMDPSWAGNVYPAFDWLPEADASLGEYGTAWQGPSDADDLCTEEVRSQLQRRRQAVAKYTERRGVGIIESQPKQTTLGGIPPLLATFKRRLGIQFNFFRPVGEIFYIDHRFNKLYRLANDAAMQRAVEQHKSAVTSQAFTEVRVGQLVQTLTEAGRTLVAHRDDILGGDCSPAVLRHISVAQLSAVELWNLSHSEPTQRVLMRSALGGIERYIRSVPRELEAAALVGRAKADQSYDLACSWPSFHDCRPDAARVKKLKTAMTEEQATRVQAEMSAHAALVNGLEGAAAAATIQDSAAGVLDKALQFRTPLAVLALVLARLCATPANVPDAATGRMFRTLAYLLPDDGRDLDMQALDASAKAAASDEEAFSAAAARPPTPTDPLALRLCHLVEYSALSTLAAITSAMSVPLLTFTRAGASHSRPTPATSAAPDGTAAAKPQHEARGRLMAYLASIDPIAARLAEQMPSDESLVLIARHRRRIVRASVSLLHRAVRSHSPTVRHFATAVLTASCLVTTPDPSNLLDTRQPGATVAAGQQGSGPVTAEEEASCVAAQTGVTHFDLRDTSCTLLCRGGIEPFIYMLATVGSSAEKLRMGAMMCMLSAEVSGRELLQSPAVLRHMMQLLYWALGRDEGGEIIGGVKLRNVAKGIRAAMKMYGASAFNVAMAQKEEVRRQHSLPRHLRADVMEQERQTAARLEASLEAAETPTSSEGKSTDGAAEDEGQDDAVVDSTHPTVVIPASKDTTANPAPSAWDTPSGSANPTPTPGATPSRRLAAVRTPGLQFASLYAAFGLWGYAAGLAQESTHGVFRLGERGARDMFASQLELRFSGECTPQERTAAETADKDAQRPSGELLVKAVHALMSLPEDAPSRCVFGIVANLALLPSPELEVLYHQHTLEKLFNRLWRVMSQRQDSEPTMLAAEPGAARGLHLASSGGCLRYVRGRGMGGRTHELGMSMLCWLTASGTTAHRRTIWDLDNVHCALNPNSSIILRTINKLNILGLPTSRTGSRLIRAYRSLRRVSEGSTRRAKRFARNMAMNVLLARSGKKLPSQMVDICGKPLSSGASNAVKMLLQPRVAEMKAEDADGNQTPTTPIKQSLRKIAANGTDKLEQTSSRRSFSIFSQEGELVATADPFEPDSDLEYGPVLFPAPVMKKVVDVDYIPALVGAQPRETKEATPVRRGAAGIDDDGGDPNSNRKAGTAIQLPANHSSNSSRGFAASHGRIVELDALRKPAKGGKRGGKGKKPKRTASKAAMLGASPVATKPGAEEEDSASSDEIDRFQAGGGGVLLHATAEVAADDESDQEAAELRGELMTSKWTVERLLCVRNAAAVLMLLCNRARGESTVPKVIRDQQQSDSAMDTVGRAVLETLMALLHSVDGESVGYAVMALWGLALQEKHRSMLGVIGAVKTLMQWQFALMEYLATHTAWMDEAGGAVDPFQDAHPPMDAAPAAVPSASSGLGTSMAASTTTTKPSHLTPWGGAPKATEPAAGGSSSDGFEVRFTPFIPIWPNSSLPFVSNLPPPIVEVGMAIQTMRHIFAWSDRHQQYNVDMQFIASKDFGLAAATKHQKETIDALTAMVDGLDAEDDGSATGDAEPTQPSIGLNTAGTPANRKGKGKGRGKDKGGEGDQKPKIEPDDPSGAFSGYFPKSRMSEFDHSCRVIKLLEYVVAALWALVQDRANARIFVLERGMSLLRDTFLFVDPRFHRVIYSAVGLAWELDQHDNLILRNPCRAPESVHSRRTREVLQERFAYLQRYEDAKASDHPEQERAILRRDLRRRRREKDRQEAKANGGGERGGNGRKADTGTGQTNGQPSTSTTDAAAGGDGKAGVEWGSKREQMDREKWSAQTLEIPLHFVDMLIPRQLFAVASSKDLPASTRLLSLRFLHHLWLRAPEAVQKLLVAQYGANCMEDLLVDLLQVKHAHMRRHTSAVLASLSSGFSKRRLGKTQVRGKHAVAIITKVLRAHIEKLEEYSNWVRASKRSPQSQSNSSSSPQRSSHASTQPSPASSRHAGMTGASPFGGSGRFDSVTPSPMGNAAKSASRAFRAHAVRKLCTPEEAFEVAENLLVVLLNLGTEFDNQPIIGEHALETLMDLALSPRLLSRIRILAGHTVQNIANHSSNRTRLYRYELSLKSDEFIHDILHRSELDWDDDDDLPIIQTQGINIVPFHGQTAQASPARTVARGHGLVTRKRPGTSGGRAKSSDVDMLRSALQGETPAHRSHAVSDALAAARINGGATPSATLHAIVRAGGTAANANKFSQSASMSRLTQRGSLASAPAGGMRSGPLDTAFAVDSTEVPDLVLPHGTRGGRLPAATQRLETELFSVIDAATYDPRMDPRSQSSRSRMLTSRPVSSHRFRPATGRLTGRNNGLSASPSAVSFGARTPAGGRRGSSMFTLPPVVASADPDEASTIRSPTGLPSLSKRLCVPLKTTIASSCSTGDAAQYEQAVKQARKHHAHALAEAKRQGRHADARRLERQAAEHGVAALYGITMTEPDGLAHSSSRWQPNVVETELLKTNNPLIGTMGPGGQVHEELAKPKRSQFALQATSRRQSLRTETDVQAVLAANAATAAAAAAEEQPPAVTSSTPSAVASAQASAEPEANRRSSQVKMDEIERIEAMLEAKHRPFEVVVEPATFRHRFVFFRKATDDGMGGVTAVGPSGGRAVRPVGAQAAAEAKRKAIQEEFEKAAMRRANSRGEDPLPPTKMLCFEAVEGGRLYKNMFPQHTLPDGRKVYFYHEDRMHEVVVQNSIAPPPQPDTLATIQQTAYPLPPLPTKPLQFDLPPSLVRYQQEMRREMNQSTFVPPPTLPSTMFRTHSEAPAAAEDDAEATSLMDAARSSNATLVGVPLPIRLVDWHACAGDVCSFPECSYTGQMRLIAAEAPPQPRRRDSRDRIIDDGLRPFWPRLRLARSKFYYDDMPTIEKAFNRDWHRIVRKPFLRGYVAATLSGQFSTFAAAMEAHTFDPPSLPGGSKKSPPGRGRERSDSDVSLSAGVDMAFRVVSLSGMANIHRRVEKALSDIKHWLLGEWYALAKLFDYYAGTGNGSNILTMTYGDYMKWLADSDIVDKASTYCNRFELDMAFVEVNRDLASASKALDDNVEAFIDGLEAQENPDRELLRYEFLEAIVRIAIMKFIRDKPVDSMGQPEDLNVVQALNRLTRFHVQRPRGVFKDIVAYSELFRMERLYSPEVATALQPHLPMLRQLHRVYSTEFFVTRSHEMDLALATNIGSVDDGDDSDFPGIHTDEEDETMPVRGFGALKQKMLDLGMNTTTNRGKRRAGLLHVNGWIALMRDLEWIDEEFTLHDARLAFAMSRMVVPDEVKRWRESTHLNVVDFIEAVCRVCEMKTTPSDADLLSLGLRAGSADMLAFEKSRRLRGMAGLEGHYARRSSAQWDAPKERPLPEKIEKLLVLMGDAVENKLNAVANESKTTIRHRQARERSKQAMASPHSSERQPTTAAVCAFAGKGYMLSTYSRDMDSAARRGGPSQADIVANRLMKRQQSTARKSARAAKSTGRTQPRSSRLGAP